MHFKLTADVFHYKQMANEALVAAEVHQISLPSSIGNYVENH